MVKRARCPGIARDYFTANELSGWADGVQYTPRSQRRKRKRDVTITPAPAPRAMDAGRTIVAR